MLTIERTDTVSHMSAPKRQPPTDENRREAAALHALWRANKARLKEECVYTQADIGERYGIGQQSTVAAYLTGKAAIGLKAAQGFALAFNCKVGDFSPRLAGELEAIRKAAARTEGREISPEAMMLARAFDSVPDSTPEADLQRRVLLGNLLTLIDVAVHGPIGIPAQVPPAQPIREPLAPSKTQL